MRRRILVLTVGALMSLVLAMSAAPAMAKGNGDSHNGGSHNGGSHDRISVGSLNGFGGDRDFDVLRLDGDRIGDDDIDIDGDIDEDDIADLAVLDLLGFDLDEVVDINV